MEQDILTAWQRDAIACLAHEPEFKGFYLTGGTALAAYYLHHRISDDLDFFSAAEVDARAVHGLANRLAETLHASGTRYSRVHDRHQFFFTIGGSETKVEFTRYPFQQIEQSRTFDGIPVDSEFDIAVNKLATILDRFDPKDFVDLYFLLKKFSLAQLRDGVEKKFALSIDALFLGSELLKARRIEALPRMVKPLDIETLKAFFASLARDLEPEILE